MQIRKWQKVTTHTHTHTIVLGNGKILPTCAVYLFIVTKCSSGRRLAEQSQFHDYCHDHQRAKESNTVTDIQHIYFIYKMQTTNRITIL